MFQKDSYICPNKTKKQNIMKTFKLSIFKGHELKHEKEVVVNSKEELKAEKNGFWSESPYKKSDKNWMGVKRIR